MKPISAEQLIDRLSEDLQDLLIREAYIRKKKEAVQNELPEKRSRVEGLQQTRPSFLFLRGKDAREGFKSAEVKLREEIAALERTLGDCDTILTKCGRIIESGLEEYIERGSETFRNTLAAQKLIPEWEAAIGLYRSCLKRLIMTLGIARNQMASGYDRKAGSLSSGALEAFNSALSAAKALESEATIPNRLAKEFRELHGLDPSPLTPHPSHLTLLPYLSDMGGAKRVAAIKAANFETARAGVSSLLAECEKVDEDLPNVIEEANQARASQHALYQAHIARPLAEIRALADSLVEPAKSEEVWISMEARFVSLTG
jgi:hypothetical protein